MKYEDIPKENSYNSMDGLKGHDDHYDSASTVMNEINFQNFMLKNVLEPKLIINGLNSNGLVRRDYPVHIFF